VQFPQTYTARRTGVSEIVPVYRGHPATISVDKLGANVAVYYSNAENASSRDGSWFLAFTASTDDLLAQYLPPTARWVAIDVLSFAEATPPRRGVKYTVTADANPHQHQDFASGAWNGAAPTAPETPALLSTAKYGFNARQLNTLWQNTGRSTPVTAFGQDVQAWDNIGTDSFTGVSGANAPTYEDGHLGFPCVRGNDTDSYLSGVIGDVIDGEVTPFTIWWVGAVLSNVNGQIWAVGDSDLDAFGNGFAGTTNWQFQVNNSLVTDPSMTSPAGFYASTRHPVDVGAPGPSLFFNNELSTNPEVQDEGADNIDIASATLAFYGRVGGATPSGHEIYEWYYWDRLLTLSEIGGLNAYGAGTYGIVPANEDPFPV
jgi:hypothetical protein